MTKEWEIAHLRRVAEGARLGLDWDENGQAFWNDDLVPCIRRRRTIRSRIKRWWAGR